MLYTGCVENRLDPLKLGRCQVRVVGVHTHNKSILPTEDLPWAYPMQPITSAAVSGIGHAPVGFVEGTWVVVMFRDVDMQQPIILGSIGGIPQKDPIFIDEEDDQSIAIDSITMTAEISEDKTVYPSGVLTTESGNVVTDGSGNPVKTESTTIQGEDKKLAGKVPSSSAKRGIDAINRAMDAAGITGKYARAAIQGIVGGECEWVPRTEGYYYSEENLVKTFPKTFTNRTELTKRYAKWKNTAERFFEFVYSPQNNGSLVGNVEPNDGALFYGRGMIQLTGRANYSRYARLSGLDLLTNPEILNLDYDVSARVAVSYFKDKVTVDQNDPAYFQAALKAVGGARSGWPKKESYYQYFLGEGSPPAQTDKSTKPGEEVQEVEIAENGLPKDRQKNLEYGFCDPNMKYPLRKYLGEPDTNRLARGRIDGTIVEFKDEKRLTDALTADGYTWAQPDIPYNAKYPFNKVMESESGHVMEFDDTPDNERVHIYHRKGTYTEIDPNGSQVNKIVGDGYTIIERNGYIHISGECNVTIGGTARVLCQGDAFVDVEGDSTINLAGETKLNVANNLDISVGQQFRLKAAEIKMESTGNFNVNSSGENLLTSGGSFEVNAGSKANIEAPTVHLAQGAATASSSGLGNPISAGSPNRQTLDQLKPPPRNLEQEMEFETPEENKTEEAKTYHENRTNEKVNDEAKPQEEAREEELQKNKEEAVPPSCQVIYGLSSIPDSYVLHTDSTGHKWTVGSITRGNSIQPIVYKGKQFTVKDIVCNMKGLSENILAKINENIGRVGSAWTITSGYRNNIPAGGSATSQHLVGLAVDFVCGANNFAYQVNYDVSVKLIQILPYDQLLLEYRDPGVNGNRNDKRINWVHVSYNPEGTLRKQALTFLNDKTYKTGLVRLA